ncbi:hypothetical protein AAE478_009808 [Parahypoxylon ruwenzoriense]
MVRLEEIRDIDLSIRFKHGIHTISLFVSPTELFSEAAKELLEALRERYPKGLTPYVGALNTTKLPSDPSKIEFAVPKTAIDLSQGWTPLNVTESDTAADKDIKDNSVVAFAFRPEDADEDYEPVFQVDFPSYEDQQEEQVEEDEDEDEEDIKA